MSLFPHPLINTSPTLTEKLSNGSFPTDLTGWALAAFGGVSTYEYNVDSVNYHLAGNSCEVLYDSPEDEDANARGVTITQTSVDLRGVETITFYAKQLSASTWYTDIQVMILVSGEEMNTQVDGKTGGDSGFIDNTWRLCTATIPTGNRLENRTVALQFYNTQSAEKLALEAVVDEISAMAEQSAPALFNYMYSKPMLSLW